MSLLTTGGEPILFCFIDPEEIAERVAVQMGCTADEALSHMMYWDRVAVETFCVGNTYARNELH